MLDEISAGNLRLEAIKPTDLPEELRTLSKDDLKGKIEQAQNERGKLQKEVAALSKERDAYIQAETKRMASKGGTDSFDQKVADIIRREAGR